MKSDVCFLFGLAMIWVGIWQLNPPVSVIVVGTVLLVVGVVSALGEQPKTTATRRSKKGSKS